MKATLGLVLAGAVATGCGSHTSSPTAAATHPTTAVPTPVVSAPLAAPTLSAEQIADTGLPSTVGPGKLSAPTLKRLMQFFEDKVGRAYATGNADLLDHYLAGPMLSGNRATIGLLSAQHRRNVFKIQVQSVKAQSNQADEVILEMTGDMTLNYFFDPRTHKILDHGLPGPSQVQFTVFLNQNPATHTWYWTGEKAGTSTASGNSETVG